MDTSGWRDHLPSGARQLLLEQLLDAMKTHSFARNEGGSHEIKKVALATEMKTYLSATSEADYFHKIGLKVLAFKKASEWKLQLLPGSRERVIAQIAEQLMRIFAVSDEARKLKVWRIAKFFEDTTFCMATTQNEYVPRISLKLTEMEIRRNQQNQG